VWKGKRASEPEVLATAVRRHAPELQRVGRETGQLAPWLYHSLKALGVPVVCLDARHARAATALQRNKTDARCIFLRHGRPSDWTSSAREALLSGRSAWVLAPSADGPAKLRALGGGGAAQCVARQGPVPMTIITAKTLSAVQLLILTAAAQRPDRMALPPPTDLRVRGAAKRALLEPGLVEEHTTEDRALSWRRDARGRHHALRITAAGLAAVGDAGGPDRPTGAEGATVQSAEHAAAADVNATPASTIRLAAALPVAAAARPGGKLGRVLDAVTAEDGATLAELVALTGWQPHTTRAALTGLRRRGFVLVLGDLESAAGRKAYRLRRHVQA
jgi:hypothetical protein